MTTTDEMIDCLRAANEIAARLLDLEARLAAKETRWNPVEKLLPKPHHAVLVFIPMSKEQRVTYRYKTGKEEGWVGCTPSHWRYLPNPPEGAT